MPMLPCISISEGGIILTYRRIFLITLMLLSACQAPLVSRAAPGGFTAEQVEVLRDNGFEQDGEAWSLGLDNRVLFATDASGVAPSELKMINKMSHALAAVGIRGARVTGHTDSTGSRTYNEKLSLDRALAVRSALVAGGFEDKAVSAAGAGSRQPIETNRNAVGRSQNRRVVILVSPADAGSVGGLAESN